MPAVKDVMAFDRKAFTRALTIFSCTSSKREMGTPNCLALIGPLQHLFGGPGHQAVGCGGKTHPAEIQNGHGDFESVAGFSQKIYSGDPDVS